MARKYIVLNRTRDGMGWGALELCRCSDDDPRGGLLLHGDCATVFSYTAARAAIQRTIAYAIRHHFRWGREYKLMRLAPNPNSRDVTDI